MSWCLLESVSDSWEEGPPVKWLCVADRASWVAGSCTTCAAFLVAILSQKWEISWDNKLSLHFREPCSLSTPLCVCRHRVSSPYPAPSKPSILPFTNKHGSRWSGWQVLSPRSTAAPGWVPSTELRLLARPAHTSPALWAILQHHQLTSAQSGAKVAERRAGANPAVVEGLGTQILFETSKEESDILGVF